ncbi:hypothetical protein HK104_009189 [Borealophlyctis nickersoniae]|nr:hypothetical protein HK104_009189 [Borealophlyctis nickersoniae]
MAVIGNRRLLRSVISLLIVLAVFPCPGHMVKQADFKKCDQSGFCRRQRAYADLADMTPQFVSPYVLVSDSLKVDGKGGLVTADLINSENGVSFAFSVNLLELNTARVQIKEKNPIKPRYDVVPEIGFGTEPDFPKSIPATNTSQTAEELRVAFGTNGQNSLVIHNKPFRFELAVNGVPAVSFNERGYLYYEQQRKKVETPALENQAAGGDDIVAPEDGGETSGEKLSDVEKDIKRLKEALETDLWEESFGGKPDSKPNGPSSIGFDLAFPGSSNVYGLPEHASSFSLKPTRGEGKTYDEPYRLYNLDVFEYELDNPMALYGAVPFMMSHKKGLSSGVLWLNSAEMWVDVEKTAGTGTLAKLASYIPFSTSKSTSVTSTETHWFSESGNLDLYIMLGPTPSDVVNAFTALSGRPAMPQQFALAYHQCRWNYLDEQDVADVDANFDKHEIPYDVLWLDIEHTDSKQYFTWDKIKFPNPKTMQQNLAVKGRKMVTIVDPHIKRDDDYPVSKQAAEKGLFVKDKDGKDYEGWCWPGNSQWLDYTNPAARRFWAEKFQFSQYEGSTPALYTWNDMNEPSVFTGPEITMGKDNIHFGGWEHRDVHNLYGMQLHRSTYEGHLLRSDNKDRPFILSRAFFVGTQRYGAIWTGDNFAKWDHMAASVPMLLSIGMSGIPFAGADVGGFFGNPEADLLLRWYQVGAFQPFFRGHAHIDTKRREPWLFGEPYTSLIRAAIRERYKLLPYIYTLSWESSRTGLPVMRPLLLEFPEDESTFALDDQFLLGSSILVKPIAEKDQASVDVYLPKSALWYDYENLAKAKSSSSGIVTVKTPLEKIPVFLRGGSILPRRDRVRRASTLMTKDPYTLLVALDDNGSATGKLYTDDGKSFEHQKGAYILTNLTFADNRLTAEPVRLSNIAKGKALSSAQIEELGSRVERVMVVGLQTAPKSVKVAGGSELTFWSEKTAGGGYKITVKDPKVWIGKSWEIVFS